MKTKVKIIRDSKDKIEFWAIPAKRKISFDQGLMNLGVQIKG
ncbi:MAG: hypothetical protein WC044_10885 [Crocinitomicaceae bacterium]